MAAPRQPGRYRLRVEMRDVKGGTLPRSDRIAIPQADVRVWGDHAVGVTVEPGPDGSGVTVRITNTGRKTIPAVPDWASSVPSEDEIQDARTTVTVTATSVELAEKDPVVLLAVPLADALKPGESVTFDVPAIGAATARTANWLSVDLRLHDDPAWAAAYLPVGILHSASTLGELTLPTPPRPEHAGRDRDATRVRRTPRCARDERHPDRRAHGQAVTDRAAVARSNRQADPGRHAGRHPVAVATPIVTPAPSPSRHVGAVAYCHAQADALGGAGRHTRADASPRPRPRPRPHRPRPGRP